MGQAKEVCEEVRGVIWQKKRMWLYCGPKGGRVGFWFSFYVGGNRRSWARWEMQSLETTRPDLGRADMPKVILNWWIVIKGWHWSELGQLCSLAGCTLGLHSVLVPLEEKKISVLDAKESRSPEPTVKRPKNRRAEDVAVCRIKSCWDSCVNGLCIMLLCAMAGCNQG